MSFALMSADELTSRLEFGSQPVLNLNAYARNVGSQPVLDIFPTSTAATQ